MPEAQERRAVPRTQPAERPGAVSPARPRIHSAFGGIGLIGDTCGGAKDAHGRGSEGGRATGAPHRPRACGYVFSGANRRDRAVASCRPTLPIPLCIQDSHHHPRLGRALRY